MTYDVIILGAGMSGMASAARLQAQGYSTLILEVHNKVGGCSGYYHRNGFSFDVGATTLVNFEPGSIGADLLALMDIELLGDVLPGYKAWLPDKTINIYRDNEKWFKERLKKFGNTPNHQKFWALFDTIAQEFWYAVDRGIKLPIQNINDVINNLNALPLSSLKYSQYIFSTLGQQVKRFKLQDQKAFIGLLSMMTEDTLHTRTINDAPFINAALGCSIRNHIVRPKGGMYGFFENFVKGYKRIGGTIALKHKVTGVTGTFGQYVVHTKRGNFEAKCVVSTLPLPNIFDMSPQHVQKKLHRFIKRDQDSYGGGVLVTLGVPDDEVLDQEEFTHHQLMHDYDAPLGDGNNMFISVSSSDDTMSAPKGHRAVMISTHSEINHWKNLSKASYKKQKESIGKDLLNFAKRAYPNLGKNAVVYDIAGPLTYQRFAKRPEGAVGGVRQTMWNSNQFSVPQDIGAKGFYLAGEYTWPGVGTTACVMGSKVVEKRVLNALN